MINVFVNEQRLEIDENTTLKQFLQSKMENTEGIAVAVNNKVIANANWHTHTLLNNDKILIIVATQGG